MVEARGQRASGRPTIIEDKPEVLERFLANVREGLSVNGAAGRTAGISASCVFEYLRQGREDRDAELDDGTEEAQTLYSQFLDRYEEAEAIGLSVVEERLYMAATDGITTVRTEVVRDRHGNETTHETTERKPDMASARWLLERRSSETYGRKDKVEHQLPAGKIVLLEGESVDVGAAATLRSDKPAPKQPVDKKSDSR